ncbi:DEAD/DEAH box helicase, partial [Candidatus Babeliales bacterium]|nr:DEAD/DEAH box helicase [Candidatus Babeliales bacterium]
VQVLDAIHKILGHSTPIKTALLIGGEDIKRQFFQLRKNPRIIVGTPGRINDHLERETVNLSQFDYLVLDETDRMLDMGFGEQIDSIINQLPVERQTLMFSATMPKNIEKMSAKYLKNPERIQIGSCLLPVEAVKQESIRISDDKKYDQLVKILQNEAGSSVIFVRTKYNAQKIADRLDRDFFKADALHGDLRQNKRDRVTQGFRAQKFTILVATDVAARGLDVSHVTLVVNYDLPQCPEDYIHRIGRTARAGATGKAINFISGKEENLWRAIERFMKTGEQGASSGFGGGQGRNSSRGGNRSGGGRRFGGRDGNRGSGKRFGGKNRKRFGSNSSSSFKRS